MTTALGYASSASMGIHFGLGVVAVIPKIGRAMLLTGVAIVILAVLSFH